MTEEEKDILQDKVLQEEANYFELNQHKLLLTDDNEYRTTFEIKEGIVRSAAKEFIQKALETPVISLGEGKTKEPKVAAIPAMVASRREDYSSSQRETSSKNLWMAVAATVLIAAVSAFFLADFRTADEFVVAQLDAGYDPQKLAISSGISRGSESIWITAFEQGDYPLVVQELRWIAVSEQDSLEIEKERLDTLITNLKYVPMGRWGYWSDIYKETYSKQARDKGFGTIQIEMDVRQHILDSLENDQLVLLGKLEEIQTVKPSLKEARFALGISKLFSPSTKRDFGAQELKWLSNLSSAIDSSELDADEVNWYLALAQYKEGDCQDAHQTLQDVANADSEYAIDAKKLRRKMRKDCGLN